MKHPANRAAALVVALLCLLPAPHAQEVPQDRAAVLARLAAIQLQVDVDRDFDGAEQSLMDLEGELRETTLAAVLSEPEAVGLRARIRAAIDAARRDDGPDLQKTVEDAVRMNDEITLTTLGARAAAVLRTSLEAKGGTPADGHIIQPLRWLLTLDEPSGWDMLKDDPLRLGPGSEPFVLRVVVDYGLTSTAYPGRAPVFDHPEWLDWVARLLETPEAVTTLCDRRDLSAMTMLIRKLATQDAFTPRITDALASLITRMDGYAAIELLNQLRGGPWAPSEQPLLEAVVADPRLAVRKAAAQALLAADLSPGLRARVNDPDAGMRLILLQGLSPRQRSVVRWGGRGENPSNVGENIPQPEDAEARALLTRLAADSEPAVREAAIGTLRKLSHPLADGVYLRLAADPDVQVRQAMVQLTHPDTALQAEIHVKLARDSEARVVTDLDNLLASADWGKQAEWLAPVLRARLQNDAIPLATGIWPQKLMAVPAAVDELTRAFLESSDKQALSLMASALYDRGTYRGLPNATAIAWKQLGGSDLARLLPALHALAPEAALSVADPDERATQDASVPDALEPIARDATQPLRLRLAACALVLHAPSEARLQLLHTLLADPSLAGGTADEVQDEWLVSSVLRSIPETARNAAVRDILEHVPLRRKLMARVVASFAPKAPEAPALARAILDRFVDDDLTFDIVEQALFVLDDHPELLDEDLMRRAVHDRYGHVATAVTTLGRLRDPRFLGLLRECLDPTWVTSANISKTDLTASAVDAIHGYMTDEAAAILLEAAANSPRANVRDAALAAVEAIGRYRDALAGWQRRTEIAVTRDSAVTRLAEIVHDPKATAAMRAEALRGLGTMQAVEQMPLLIESLASDDTAIREAARAALDRLNALPEPAPSQEAAPPKGN